METNQKTKEVAKMRKTLITVIVALLSVVLTYGFASAISGVCSNCHTMHASQNGTATTPNDNLTASTCIGCHNGGVAGAPNIFGDPGAPDTMTAGGTFLDSVFTTDAKGHNVKDLVDAVGFLDTAGAENTAVAVPGNAGSTITTVTITNLTCAGANGCHGDHDAGKTTSGAGISGFHHRPGATYRFLQTTADTPIIGKGSTDWELGGATNTNHNVYSAGGTDSISILCAQCHGTFHGTGNTNASSPFKRHPTENAIPDAWDAVGTGVSLQDYDRNPVAFSGTDYTNAAVGTAYDLDITTYADGPKVACVSCHRAHGSPNDDILRFAYSSQSAGGGNTYGCLGCHTNQR